jgi:hypothetical protein
MHINCQKKLIKRYRFGYQEVGGNFIIKNMLEQQGIKVRIEIE